MGLFDTIGDFLSGGKMGKAEGASQAAIDALQSLQLPDVAQMQLQLEDLVQQGVLTPQQAQTFLQQRSEMGDISTDPQLLSAQMDALHSLQDVSNEGGLTASDKAQLSDIATQEQTQQRGAREAILQNMQARGMGGSGMELLSQMQNQQDSASRQSARDLDVAGMAQQRALAALQAAGQLGGQMQSTSFNQQAQKAAAEDAINKFNTANMQNTTNMNVNANNAAQASNLANKQRVADANVGTHNAQQQYNKQLQQQQFDNAYKKAGGVANTYNNQASLYNDQGKQNTKTAGDVISFGSDMAGSMMSGGGGAAAAAHGGVIPDFRDKDEDAIEFNSFNPGSEAPGISDEKSGGGGGSGMAALLPLLMMMSDEECKKDVKDGNAKEFMDHLDPKEYTYKDSSHGEGRQLGVMAQDMEQADPSLVKNTKDGKAIDYSKAGGPIMASLGDLNRRLSELENKDEGQMAAKGGMIKGKAMVPGDSYKNDKVKTYLSPGELVIPRSIADNPDAVKQFAKNPPEAKVFNPSEFMDEILGRKPRKGK